MKPEIRTERARRIGSDWPFVASLFVVAGTYLLLILALLVADAVYMVKAPAGQAAEADSPFAIARALADPNIQYSIKLTLLSSTVSAILSVLVAIPVGYALSRYHFFGKSIADAVLDIPIVLPPLVVGISLLILFQYVPTSLREAVVYQKPAVILAQFMVACAFAVRTMRATFDQIDRRHEQVALTLGCTHAQAFGWVLLPEAARGIITAGTLAWARSMGEFGPLLVFAGATRGKTEVLSTTVFLELSIGDLEAAVAVSLIMVFAAMIVLVLTRQFGSRSVAV